VGPALARLWNGWLAAGSAAPPGERDQVLLIERGNGGPSDAQPLPIEFEGAVRALAAGPRGDSRRLAVAVEPLAGGAYLELLELRRVEAEP
jgi:hypothetical protein